MPLFGTRVDGCPYIVRPSAYAIVRNAAAEIAVAHTPEGWFLPGGGIEAGEAAGEAVIREAREECGLAISPRGVVGTATEIVHSARENATFEKPSTFFIARVDGFVPAVERDHTLVWLDSEAAIERLTHESHRWAVRRCIS